MSGDQKTDFVIHIDGVMHKVSSANMSGAQLKALAGRDSTYQLYLELKSNEPDRQISDTDSVKLENGMHFYTVPSATLGNDGSTH